ncbi:metallo-beta-lactamase family protein [Pontibacter ummariensis]|uniref:Metallo-beta-lactamase family protein n=1 Tax=Pontibacter ummariensis TaxID=1610492 RepID=A0A239FRF1_9BACT|nr:MBL fold metallo-hydrolase [Pontibacter ummariensis]PRY11980.1 metallo-beta-lactamase family protein [Pontibacter ummariensis]SNS58773.1 metallo-beta-lactamase family protein [Pontibacter ummariensis]
MEKESSIQLQFIGAAGTVTGSRTLLQTENYKILIDCGLFQGKKSERKLNKAKRLPFKPSELDAIILTHGHLDHSGYLPALVKKGFTGPIYATAPTKDITEIILHDSAKIQEEDAHEANKRRKKNKKPRKPLYKQKHVHRTMQLFKTFGDNQWESLNEESKFCFQTSGHILGSASVELECKGRRFVFSGDLGQQAPLILAPPTRMEEADYIIMESTYGDKLHNSGLSPFQALQEVVNATFEKGGVLVIPSFAVERAQEIILILNTLMEEKSIPHLPIFLDSPMGIDVTKLFQEHRKWHTLTDNECEALTKNVHIVSSFEETLNVLHEDGPKQKIIIAGSGMVTGGRVLYYLKQLLSDKKNTVLLVGHQGTGTRGRKLLSGASHVKIDGKHFEVGAEIHQIGSLSAHADQEDLLWWLAQFKKAPKQLFLNHGEEEPATALKQKIEETYKWPVTIAKMDKVYHL